ncbi:MAG: hypothetical protein EOO24_33755 [Comamonadaceae bacterium]|nr:MAG: hypothetical protein EOO24_33755 [Comamonadaceae bacterium]
MKKLSFVIAAATTLLSLGTLGTTAQATPFGHSLHAQVFVQPGPPPRQYYAPPPPPHHYRHDRHDRRWDDRRWDDRRWDDRRHGGYRRDRDGDGA